MPKIKLHLVFPGQKKRDILRHLSSILPSGSATCNVSVNWTNKIWGFDKILLPHYLKSLSIIPLKVIAWKIKKGILPS